MPVTHTFVSAKDDDSAAEADGQVLPSHWNAGHTIDIDLDIEVSGNLPNANLPTGMTFDGTTLSVTNFSGNGSALTSLNGTNISSGTVDPARLGSGSSISTKYLRGDGTWQTVSGSGTPGGSDTHVQFNDGGAFGGEAALKYNKTTDVLTCGVFNCTSTQAFQRNDVNRWLIDNLGLSSMDFLNGSTTLRVGEFSVIGTNDCYFQALPGAAGWGYLENWGGQGMILGTGYTGPVLVRPLRTTVAYFYAGVGEPACMLVSASTSGQGLVVRLRSGQSANAIEVQNSATAVLSALKPDGSWQPPAMADSAAINGTIYYSTTGSKMAHKDGSGTVNYFW